MTSLRVAYVLNIFPKISETFIAGELAELRRRRVELRILSLLPPRDEPRHDIITRAGLDRLTSYDVPAFNCIIREFQPQMLHAHFAKEATEKARELSLELGIPYCFTAHGYDIHRKPPQDFHDRAMGARAVVTVSQSNADYIASKFNVPGTHLRVIPCGVDTSVFRPSFARPPRTALPLIVCVARLVEVKCLSLLLQACGLLKSRGVKFQCLLAGDGPMHDQLVQQRSELRLHEEVKLLGAVDQKDVLRMWQQATVGVLTSDNEGMPISLMEAAACAVPVVATTVGGIPELVHDGVTGILCRRGDANGVADALQRLITDTELRRKMGEAARRHAEQRFSIVHHVDALLRVWNEALTAVPV